MDLSTLKPGQQVLVVVCASGDNQLVITKIVAIDNEDDNNNEAGGGTIKCWSATSLARKAGIRSAFPPSAVPAHLGHGDKLGACP